MAGTDKTQERRTGGPVVVLVAPQLGENIGFAARAMLNCGLTRLRLVRPRDGWPNEKARAAAAGADAVVDGVQVFDTTVAAIADLARVFAATARPRDMIKPVMTPRHAAAELRAEMANGVPCGLLFGPERSGLENDDVALADTVIQVPLNPAFSSLSLPQAVLLAAYEWFQAEDDTPGETLTMGRTEPATKADLVNLFERLEAALDDAGFLHVAEKRPGMVRNIRNIFQRARLTEQEVRTLHGIVSALANDSKKGSA
ncbi:MAG: RNA methyltransferase [Alphaproteobacteria bacterium]|nr:RNA methyltransferase [Alphaproteobacteria bacterium]